MVLTNSLGELVVDQILRYSQIVLNINDRAYLSLSLSVCVCVCIYNFIYVLIFLLYICICISIYARKYIEYLYW